jgi:hypothetical protein
MDMRVVKYIALFLVLFVASQFLLAKYYDSKLLPNNALIDYSKKYNIRTISRIQVPLLIDLGKVGNETIEGEFEVKNIGNFDLTELQVSGDCTCTSIGFKIKDLHKGKTSIVEYKIDLSSEKGWFSKTIILKGSLYPFKRFARIEGYKL